MIRYLPQDLKTLLGTTSRKPSTVNVHPSCAQLKQRDDEKELRLAKEEVGTTKTKGGVQAWAQVMGGGNAVPCKGRRSALI